MEAKFGPLKKRIKTIDISPDDSFQKNSRVHPFGSQKHEDIFEELKVEPFDKDVRRYKLNWLRHVTRMNSNRMPKIMLNYVPDGRRRLGRPLKRLLDEAETGLSRPNW
jgi:hypothetical protein